MTKLLKRFKLQAADALRFARPVRIVLVRAQMLADRLSRTKGTDAAARRITKLCRAARLAADDPIVERIETRLRKQVASTDWSGMDWARFIPGVEDRKISKAAVLKPWISDREKGVVFVSFEDQWARLLCLRNLREFAQRYSLVVSPTWCPPHSLVNVAFPAVYPDTIFSLISNVRDREIFPRLAPNYSVIPLYASSWVNPAFFQPQSRDRRDIDIIMIANFGKYKRHHALFRAMQHMPRSLRATLIGQPQDGRDSRAVLAEAALYGVADRVSIHSSVTNEFLADALCRARISLIMSRREGSCVAVTESMFADTPVGLLDSAEIGSKAFVNAHTGRLLREKHLATDILDLFDSALKYQPRQWALEHISCHQSTRSLNSALREHALRTGGQWTRDIATLYWRPDPRIIDPTPDLTVEQAYIRAHFGIQLGTPPCEAARQPLRPDDVALAAEVAVAPA